MLPYTVFQIQTLQTVMNALEVVKMSEADDETKERFVKRNIKEADPVDSTELANAYRTIVTDNVGYTGESKKGPSLALADTISKAITVGKAMEFVGMHVDEVKVIENGKVALRSKGYYHHYGA